MIPETISSLLHQCSKSKSFRRGFSLHAVVLKTGLQSDVFISNHVVNMYAKCGKLDPARRVFDDMSERNLVSWSAMISGYDQVGDHALALELFSRMRLVPNEYVFGSAISACAGLRDLIKGQQIHAQSLKFGYAYVSFVSNSLISMYMKCARCDDALSVYEEVSEPNSVSFNALIGGFVENQQPEKGFELFKLMHRQGLMPDCFTFAGLLEICNNSNNLKMGMVLHCHTIKLKLDSTAFVGNLIMTMYSKFSLVEEAEKVFRLIEEKDVISWNTLIAACSHCADHEKGLRVFKEMSKDCSVKPDDFTHASVLAACAGLASVLHGKEIHAQLIRARLGQDVGVGNALVNMYTKCGFIGYSYEVFSKMLHRNLVSWNTIIAGYGNHGLGRMAIKSFEQMITMGIKPDSVTFVGLLIACNHAGLVEEGELYFNSMEETYRIRPNIEHFSCLIDLMGRAGKLPEAEEYMKRFPFGMDPVVLGSLLSACRSHGDVVMGERLAKQLLNLQPVSTSPYVLLSNLYASDAMWVDVAEARKMLKGSGMKKEPGYSMVAVKGTFEKFTVGDFSHSRIQEIKYMLKILRWAAVDVCSNHDIVILLDRYTYI
ncbi:hypothetical protein LWI29_030880 [Acer saccharum]|uniref:Pentatricopeptide repeat-containing protein n=1 Tax=Acer saccharum TaxID=4024 RepID=A0AA39VZB5_ACESA|nr:hypothetical protein LWI29_030880 [Acer saccharum]